MFNNNKERYLKTCENYLYKMKLDIESFFPNLYTHYFEKIVNKNQKDKYTMRKEVLTSFFLDNKYELVTRKQIVALFSIPKSDLSYGEKEEIAITIMNKYEKYYTEIKENRNVVLEVLKNEKIRNIIKNV